MKSLAISLAAAWSSSVRSFVDGNTFRESNIDFLVGDIADRLGYLKNALDGKANLAGSNALTGYWTWAAGAVSGIRVLGDNGVWTTDLRSDGFASFYNQVTFDALSNVDVNGPMQITTSGQIQESITTLADANATIPGGGVHFRVPTLTANRTYTLPNTGNGTYRRIRLERPRTADAFTATLQTSGAVTMGVISISAAGWIEVVDGSAGWVVVGYGGTVTSLSTTV